MSLPGQDTRATQSQPTAVRQTTGRAPGTGSDQGISRCAGCGAPFSGAGSNCASCRRNSARAATKRRASAASEPKAAAASRPRVKAASKPRVKATELDDRPRPAVRLLGYLLASGGFAATLQFGVWLAIGFLCVTAGCALGLAGTPGVRWRNGILTGLLLSTLGTAIHIGVLAREHEPGVNADQGPSPFLELTVQTSRRVRGELVVQGVVLNTGEGEAFSPAVELEVYEASSGTLVAIESAYPVGTFETALASGDAAPFRNVAVIPDGVDQIEWEIILDEYPGTVVREEATRP